MVKAGLPSVYYLNLTQARYLYFHRSKKASPDVIVIMTSGLAFFALCLEQVEQIAAPICECLTHPNSF